MNLFDKAGLMSFEELIQQFKLSKEDFFHFVQTGNYIFKDASLCYNRSLSPIEQLLFQTPGKKSVSDL